jgi:hypothetical protein
MVYGCIIDVASGPMIYFLSKHAHEYTWRRAIAAAYSSNDPSLWRELFRRITLLSYEKLFSLPELPLGSYVFADLERLTVNETERAALCWNALVAAGPTVRLFNHPSASMRRYELLRYLYQEGINHYDAQRLTEPFRLQHFPVFIRAEDSHFEEDMGPLLCCQAELEKASADLLAAGKSRENKLIVEYIDVRDSSGSFHYFTACLAAGEIIFMGYSQSQHWVVKTLGNAPDRQDALQPYIVAHGPMLKHIFQLARIDYGRIDYALVDGKIQVFEINTNPTIGSTEYLLKIARLLDSFPTQARIPLPQPKHSKRGEPPRRGKRFRILRRLHLILSHVGLLQYEPTILRVIYFFSGLLKGARCLIKRPLQGK